MAYSETQARYCGDTTPDHLCRASLTHRFHRSVGAVLFRHREIGVLYSPKGFANPWGFTNFDQVMRESPEAGEDDFDTVERGALEEFGADGFIRQKLGRLSVEVAFSNFGETYQKNTQYYLFEVDNVDESRREAGFDGIEGAEGSLEVLWLPPEVALVRQERQLPLVRRHRRPDLYEAPIIREAQEALDALSPHATVIDLGAYH